jgi:hypothetical protein
VHGFKVGIQQYVNILWPFLFSNVCKKKKKPTTSCNTQIFPTLDKKIEASRFAKLSRITTTTSFSQNIQYVENDEM